MHNDGDNTMCGYAIIALGRIAVDYEYIERSRLNGLYSINSYFEGLLTDRNIGVLDKILIISFTVEIFIWSSLCLLIFSRWHFKHHLWTKAFSCPHDIICFIVNGTHQTSGADLY